MCARTAGLAREQAVVEVRRNAPNEPLQVREIGLGLHGPRVSQKAGRVTTAQVVAAGGRGRRSVRARSACEDLGYWKSGSQAAPRWANSATRST